MPKSLMIIRGSLYKQAEASCNKSLGTTRKWKINVRREVRGKKNILVIAPETSYCPNTVSQYFFLNLKEWTSIKLALPHAGFLGSFIR